MNFWLQWTTSDMARRFGWTLLHALWQGALVWAVLVVFLLLARRRAAQVRYVACGLALLLLVALPAVTFWRQTPEPPVAITGGTVTNAIAIPATPGAGSATGAPAPELSSAPRTIAPKASLASYLGTLLQPALPWLVSLWLIGVWVVAGWHAAGWLLVRRRFLRGSVPPPAEWQRHFTALTRRFNVGATLRISAGALTPLVVGVIRPVVLFPAALLTGLSMDQVTALLVHELAHVRRHDYLVNLLQSLVETVLFYHPSVWWISRQIRRERELCCDDLALAFTENRLAYATALAAVAQGLPVETELAMAASGGELLGRIRRIVTGQSPRVTWMSVLVSGVILAAVSFTLLNAGCQTDAAAPASRDIAATPDTPRPNPTVPELLAALAKPAQYLMLPNLSGLESAVRAYMREIHYQPRATDEPALLAAMNDDTQNAITRMCVAGYLLDFNNTAARQFILAGLDSVEPRQIQESAQALLFHLQRQRTDDWAINQILRVIVSDQLYKARYFDEVYETFTGLKLKVGEPELIAALKRHPSFGTLASAVGNFDDAAATAALAATLESGGGLRVPAMNGELQVQTEINAVQYSILQQRHYPGLAQVLARHLDDSHGLVAVAVCYSDDKSLLPALRDYVAKKPNTENAKYYVIAIARLEATDKQDMIARLSRLLDATTDHYVRGRIIGVLQDTKDPAVIPAVLRMMQTSTYPGNLMDGIFTLEAIGGPKSTRALVTLLDRDFTSDGSWLGKPTSPFSLQEWVVRALEKTTEQKFGTDKQKWRDYAARLPDR